MKPVTDPSILAQLEGGSTQPAVTGVGQAVTDPALLAQLEGPDMLPSHRPGEVIAQPRQRFRPPTVDEQRQVMGVSRPGSKVFKTPEETRQAALELADTAGVVGGAIVSPLTTAAAGFRGVLHEGNNSLDKAASDIRATQEALSYQPRTESGQQTAKALAYPFEKLAEGGKYLGEKTFEATGSPIAATTVDTAVNMLPFAIPFLKKGYVAGKAAIMDSTWYRKATIPERSLVMQSIDEVAAGLKSQGWSDGQVDAKLARLDPSYFQEQLSKRAVTEAPKAEPVAELTPAAEPAPTAKEPLTGPPEATPVSDPAIIAQLEAAPETGIPATEQTQPLPPYTPAVNQPVSLPEQFIPQQSEVIPNGETKGQTSTEEGNGRNEGLLNTPEVSAPLNNVAEPASRTQEMPVLPNAQIPPVNPLDVKSIETPAPQPEMQSEVLNIQPEEPNGFERLSPAGRRGAVQSFTVNVAPSQHSSLREIRQEVSDGEAGKRMGTNMGQMDTAQSEQVSWGSSFPEYFQNKNLTKKQVLPVLDRIIKGESVTEAQWLMAEDMLKAKRYDTLNKILNIRAEQQLARREVSSMDWESRLQEAEDYFKKRGGFDEITETSSGPVRTDEPTGAGRVYQAPVSDLGTEQTVRTESIDQSGWGQQVAPELQGDKKAVKFGDKKPTGRNVGLSEFMDGFDDPQNNLFSKTPSNHADTGGYNLDPPGPQNEVFGKQKVAALELPEIVEIAKTLMGGQYPHILRKLHKRGALGVFKTGKGSIDLVADLAKTPGLLERVLAHEVGHLIDWLPDKDIKRGNILGRIASLKKYMGNFLSEYEGGPAVLSKKDRARLRRSAENELKANERPEETVIETITREVPQWKYTGITTDMIKDLLGLDAREKYPKLYRAFQEMGTAEKKAVLVQAMKGIVHDKVSHFGERVQTGTETVTEQIKRTVPGVSATPEQISKRYAQLVEEEINKRRLYKRETINDELKNLTMHWKPFAPGQDPGYTAYRFSSVELYADALSALINDPATLRKIAPTFEKAFFSYLGRKPEVSNVYYDIQQRLNNGEAISTQRQKNIRSMFDKGEATKKETERRPLKGILHSLYKDLIDENADINLRVKWAQKAGARIEDADNPVYWVEQLPYVSGEVYNHLHAIDTAILEPLKAEGLTVDDMGEYMMLKRITTDRAELANPLGHTADTATAQLKALEKQLGQEKWDALLAAVEQYKAIRAENVIGVVDKAQMWGDDLMKHVKDNEDYATFEVQKFIEAKYGRGVSAQIYKQVGTLQEIRNPFISTVMKDAALIRGANIKMVKHKVVGFMRDHFAGEMQPAETQWNGKFNAPVEPANPDMGMIMYPHKGEIQAFYVPKGIADTFSRSPYEASVIIKAWQAMNIPLRAVLVNHNPLWMMANVPRDFIETWKNTQGITAFDLIKYYGKAAPEAYREVFKGEMSKDISDMLKNKSLVVDRQFTTIDEAPDSELDRMLLNFGKSPVQYRNKVIKPFMMVWDTLGKAGQFTERLGKVAGYKYLQDTTSYGPERTGHMVRAQISTPDVHRGGKLKPIYNNVFLFSNVAMNGWRASWEAMRDAREKDGTKKEGKSFNSEYAWKTTLYNIIPKLMMKAAALGVMGATVKKIMDSASNYDKTNYHVIPLGFDDKGKAVYWRIPQDYSGTLLGGVLWNAMEGKIVGDKSALSFASEQSPYGLNPYLGAATDIVQVMRGLNPYDDFRGQTVVPDQVFKAKDSRTYTEVAKHEWNNLGGSAIYRFRGAGPDKVESELEKVLKRPPGNILGRFLKVSNQGEREQLKEVTDEVGQKEARKSLDVKDAIINDINDKDGKSTVSDKVKLYRSLLDEKKLDLDTKFSEFRPRYERYMSKVENSAKIDAVVNAASQGEKAALIEHYKKTLPDAEYQKIIGQLLTEGHIKAGTFKEMELRKSGLK